MKKLAAALLLLAAVPARSAEVPRLLADINRDPADSSGSLYPPQGFFELGGRLFFSTAGILSGDEGILWSTDGSPESLEVLSSKICPSPCQEITPVAKLGDTVLLRVTQLIDFSQPIIRYGRTDGTPSGTFLLTGDLGYLQEEILVPGSPQSSPPSSPPNKGLFYFVAYGLSEVTEIWRTDGTVAGTRPLRDPSAGPFIRYPDSLTAWGGRLYFLAEEHQEGSETDRFGLWSTDGTPRGTRFVYEFGEAEGFYSHLAATPSRLFFTSGKAGEDLWVTDGTPGGSRLLHEFEPRSCSEPDPDDCPSPGINSLTAVGDAVYFVVRTADERYELWESDGTPGGTRSLVLFPAGVAPDLYTLRRVGDRWLVVVSGAVWTADAGFSHAAPLTGCEGGSCPAVQSLFGGPDPGHLLFSAEDAAHGLELWTTDGTAAGTRRLSDACPGACHGIRGDLSYWVLGTSQNHTWFRAYPEPDTEPSGSELWVTDGTPGGTRRVTGYTGDLGFLDGTAYFGRIGPGETGGSTAELWAAGGSPASVYRIGVLKRSAPGSFPRIVPLSNGGALLAASDGTYRQPWRSDGTPGGTRPLAVPPLLDTLDFFRAGSPYFFTASRPVSEGSVLHEIWRTDGTDRGTRRLADLAPGTYVDLQTVWKDKYLFLVGGDGSESCSFWTSDGTRAGTAERVSLPGMRCPSGLHSFGSRFLFVARVEQAGGDLVPQLFASDGTPAGTRQLTRLRGDRAYLETEFAEIDGVAFFRLYDQFSREPEIWRTDGTLEGTHRAFPGLLYPSPVQAFRGALYFTAYTDSDRPRALFRATPDGTPPVRLTSTTGYGYQELFFGELPFTPVGNRLFFTLHDEWAGQELWVTDGTPGGTQRVRDIQPGPGSSAPESLTVAGDRVFFSADDGRRGRELWVSDGTAKGTRMVWDLNPGGFSSSPESLAVSGSNLFFAADDGETGVEPWVLRLER